MRRKFCVHNKKVPHRNVVYQNIFVSTKSEKRKRRGRKGEKMRLSGTERKDEEKMDGGCIKQSRIGEDDCDYVERERKKDAKIEELEKRILSAIRR